MLRVGLLACLVCLAGLCEPAFAQDRAEGLVSGMAAQVPVVEAFRLDRGQGIDVDGRLDEGAWAVADRATGFVQIEPSAGLPSSERTEAYVLFDEAYIYVAFKAYVSNPSRLVRKLVRRDNFDTSSDRVFVEIGSPADGRTAFSFGVNLAGVQQDVLLFDDKNDGDLGWDAVWESAVGRFEDASGSGYTVEYRIPLSQLRYDPQSLQPWQIQFQRDIAATGERTYWAPLMNDTDGYVSRFGSLVGLMGLRAPRRIELLPYASSRVTREPGDAANPFYSATALAQEVGLDAKIGLSNGITLTGTINPDFGQVEQDPADVNLTDFETFFGERRPFFVEGTDVFSFGATRGIRVTDRPTFFYSRRIGRAPLAFGQSNAALAGQAAYVDSPSQTTILGAAKISGQAGPWTLGVLNAVTAPEFAAFARADGSEGRALVEPLATYFVGRARRNWGSGATLAGGFLSSVLRNTAIAFEPLLPSDALVGGIDGEHAFGNRNWAVSGVLAGSVVRGSPDYLTAQQRASRRYFQRTDVTYLGVDPGLSSLAGYRAELALSKLRGRFVRGSITLGATSPGFEVNDLGFQTRADLLAADWYLDYTHTSPRASWLNRFNAIVYGTQAVNYGGEHISNRFVGTFNWFFSNLWFGQVGWSARPEFLNDRLTRGGPVAARPADGSLSAFLRTNLARPVSLAVNAAGRTEFKNDHLNVDREWTVTRGATLRVRPSGVVDVEVAPYWESQLNTDQFVRSAADVDAPEGFGGRRYVFADVRSETFFLGVRTNWSFTPALTVQIYAGPFVGAYRFSGYRELAARRTYDFLRYGENTGTFTPEVLDEGAYRPAADGETADRYAIDPQDGSAAFTIPNQDFRYLSLRGNAVLRWQWRPGSALFVVWQQTRDQSDDFGGLDVVADLPDILDTEVRNVFLVKATYWFGL